MVVVGAGTIAELIVAESKRLSGPTITAFAVERAHRHADRFADRPLIDLEQLVTQYPPSRHDAVVAIGYTHLNAERARLFEMVRGWGYRLPGWGLAHASIVPPCAGANVIALSGARVEPYATIGDNVVLWSGAHLSHHSELGAHVFMAPGSVVAGFARIGERSFIGANATILDRVTIGARCVIGAGALMHRDAADDGLYFGNPATRQSRPALESDIGQPRLGQATP